MARKIILPRLPVALNEGQQAPPAHRDELAQIQVRDADWSNVTSLRLQLDVVVLERVQLTLASLREGSWMDVRVSGAEASGLDVAGLTGRRIEILSSRLSGVIMSESNLRDVVFRGCKFDLANFRFAKLTSVLFDDCDLTEADLSGATLSGVTFSRCQLRRTNFDAAVMADVDLTASTLTGPKGVRGLSGAIIGYDQLASLAPQLATELGIKLKE